MTIRQLCARVALYLKYHMIYRTRAKLQSLMGKYIYGLDWYEYDYMRHGPRYKMDNLLLKVKAPPVEYFKPLYNGSHQAPLHKLYTYLSKFNIDRKFDPHIDIYGIQADYKLIRALEKYTDEFYGDSQGLQFAVGLEKLSFMPCVFFPEYWEGYEEGFIYIFKNPDATFNDILSKTFTTYEESSNGR